MLTVIVLELALWFVEVVAGKEDASSARSLRVAGGM